jgi:hypothetical protein
MSEQENSGGSDEEGEREDVEEQEQEEEEEEVEPMDTREGRTQDWDSVTPLLRPYARYRVGAFEQRARRWRYGSAALREIRQIHREGVSILGLEPLRRVIREILNETPNSEGQQTAWRMDVCLHNMQP